MPLCCGGYPYGYGGGLIGKRSVKDTDDKNHTLNHENIPSRVPLKRRLPLIKLRQITFTTKTKF